MVNIPARVRTEMNRFKGDGLRFSAQNSFSSAKRKAGIVKYTGEMEKGIKKDERSSTNIIIKSTTEQGNKFENGFKGMVNKSDPKIKRWADTKLNKYAFQKWQGGVNFQKSPAFKFMWKSIPTELKLRNVMDEAFRKNAKGGRVNG
jgi:hypothetical protein